MSRTAKKWLICFCSHVKPSNNSFVIVIANILWHVVFYTFDITHRRYLNDLFCIWVRQGEKNNRLNMLMGHNNLSGSISEEIVLFFTNVDKKNSSSGHE
jgi:hypothetical protein